MKMFVAFIFATAFIVACFLVLDSRRTATSPKEELTNNLWERASDVRSGIPISESIRPKLAKGGCPYSLTINPRTVDETQDCFKADVESFGAFGANFNVVSPISAVLLDHPYSVPRSRYLSVVLQYKKPNKHRPTLIFSATNYRRDLIFHMQEPIKYDDRLLISFSDLGHPRDLPINAFDPAYLSRNKLLWILALVNPTTGEYLH